VIKPLSKGPLAAPPADQVPGMQLARLRRCVKAAKPFKSTIYCRLSRSQFASCPQCNIGAGWKCNIVAGWRVLALVVATVRPAPPMAADILAFQPGDGLVEALGAVAVSGVVGGMAETRIRNLALQLGKVLIVGFREIGEVERLILHLLVEALERGPAVDELG